MSLLALQDATSGQSSILKQSFMLSGTAGDQTSICGVTHDRMLARKKVKVKCLMVSSALQMMAGMTLWPSMCTSVSLDKDSHKSLGVAEKPGQLHCAQKRPLKPYALVLGELGARPEIYTRLVKSRARLGKCSGSLSAQLTTSARSRHASQRLT